MADELNSGGYFLSGVAEGLMLQYFFRFDHGYFIFDEVSLVRAPSIDLNAMLYVLNAVEIGGKLREPGWYDYYKGAVEPENPGDEIDRYTPIDTPFSVTFSAEAFEQFEKAPFAYEVFRKEEVDV